ncbi:glutamate 5-kinase [Lacticigenium naphthae]|uniref:glutamate 5-kinase n=1 Tax=Lacticigenium naphthae TaxID=515351 RepID=UPI0003FB3183|nr:glutamate 5-kinase [Lacticigenium naphthae]
MNREFMKDYKRIVIKIGTNSIMKSVSKVDYRKIDRLAFVCSSLQQAGKEVILVSSGAVGVGASVLKLKEYPKSIGEQQAVSSVGQSALMNVYSRFFQQYNQFVGQILMTRDVVDFPLSYENSKTAIQSLLDKQVIPIINENDAVSVEEMNHQTKFGDNDTLSAIVSELIDADLLIIMSDVEGLFDANPMTHKEAKLIPYVSEITEEIRQMAGGVGSDFATGGMQTKIVAAERMLAKGKAVVITSSEFPVTLFDIVEGQEIGTLFKKMDK